MERGSSPTTARCDPAGEAAQPVGRGQEAPALPDGLVFVVADDDEIARLVATRVIRKCRADMSRSFSVGATRDEVLSLPLQLEALGRELGQMRVVCIFDENLNYAEGDLRGTELCRQLRSELGWEGVIIIQSANDSEEDVRLYLAAGADACHGKGVGGGIDHSVAQISRAYARRVDAGRA